MERELQILNCHESAWVYDIIDYDTYMSYANEIFLDLIQDRSVHVDHMGDEVYLDYEADNWCLHVEFGVQQDSLDGRWYVSDGYGWLEYDADDGYIIVEDMHVEADMLHAIGKMPNVDKRRRDAVRERRAMRRDYYRSVM